MEFFCLATAQVKKRHRGPPDIVRLLKLYTDIIHLFPTVCKYWKDKL